MTKGVSIIMCCYNSEKKINASLEHIRQLKLLENNGCELIIVDNNSIDNTLQIIKGFASASPINTVIISEQQIGKPYALAKGFSAAQYEYLIICDDDNGLDSEYVRIAFEMMESNPGIGFIGGTGIIKTDGELPAWYYLLENCYAVGSQYEKDGDITKTRGYVWGAGMVLRKKVWMGIIENGFQGFLTGRKTNSVLMTGEDTEMCMLGKALGYTIYFDSRLKYFHYIPQTRITWKYLIQLWQGFSRSQVYFDMYEAYFKSITVSGQDETRWITQFNKNAAAFFSGFSTLNWYKGLYITFVENRKGYLYGLEKRKYLYRMKELLKNFFSYNAVINKIASFKIEN